ncbi:MAG: cysteine ABC transporter substrate-binding protein [Lactobacillales bacterium]|nr:cysteine ABC transporter substrate-binding protein [Lactobacillales bacterium]
MKKIIYVISVLALFTLFLTGCSKKGNLGSSNGEIFRTLDEIKKSKTVKIGVFSDKHPFGYVDEEGKYQGYDIYFAERLAKDLGTKIEYVSTDPANRAEYLKTGKVDIMMANFTITKERAEVVDFALPYMKISLGVVSPNNAVIKNVKDLKGETLIVAKGTTADTYFTENHPEVKLLKFDQYMDTYNALKDKRGDAMSTDNTEVLAWALQNKGFTVGIKNLGNTDTIAPAVTKGNKTLLKFINNDIKKLGKENFFLKDFNKTLKPVYGNNVKPEDIIVEGGNLKK